MKILLIADVHHRRRCAAWNKRKTLRRLKRVIARTPCDLIVWMGDIVHGPDYGDDAAAYVAALCEVLDLTGDTPFATVFGNHDDECAVTKEQILSVIASYPNALTQGRDYVLRLGGETLLFIDSGAYYDGDESVYDVVGQGTVDFALGQIRGTKAILFQHIIVPDITDCLAEGRKAQFRKGVSYTGKLGERPCPPAINAGEWRQLAPHLKGAVFAHDHKNSFELDLDGVRVIQCPGCGYNSYERFCKRGVKLLDTQTMQTTLIEV